MLLNSFTLCNFKRLLEKCFFCFEQGIANFGILATRMGGSGDRESKWDGKFYPQGLNILFLQLIRFKVDQMGPQTDQKGLQIMFCTKKYLFCGDYTLSEEIILNEISVGGSPTIILALA